MLNGINLDSLRNIDLFDNNNFETVRMISVRTMNYVKLINKSMYDAAEGARISFKDIVDKVDGSRLVEELRQLFFETAKLVESHELHPDKKALGKIQAIATVSILANRGLNLMLNAVLNVEHGVERTAVLERFMGYHGQAMEISDMILSLVASSQLLIGNKSHARSERHEEPVEVFNDEHDDKKARKVDPDVDFEGVVRTVKEAGGTVFEHADGRVVMQVSRDLFHKLVAVDPFEFHDITVSGNKLGELRLRSDNHNMTVVMSQSPTHRG